MVLFVSHLHSPLIVGFKSCLFRIFFSADVFVFIVLIDLKNTKCSRTCSAGRFRDQPILTLCWGGGGI